MKDFFIDRTVSLDRGWIRFVCVCGAEVEESDLYSDISSIYVRTED